MRGDQNTGKFNCYVPRVLLRRLATASEEPVLTLEGTVVLADVSGFTRLSERLARVGGDEGAEHLADAINWCFSALLSDAYAGGGSLLKFGGDAMLLWFEGRGHALRACASAAMMRSTLRRVGRLNVGATKLVLRMSVGVHSGKFETFLVGESHREHVIGGPAVTRVVELEAAASAGQVLLSRETAELLPNSCLGATAGPGILLTRLPSGSSRLPDERPARPSDEAIARCLSTALREHVVTAPAMPEHRNATMGFVQFGGLDEVIDGEGAEAAARALHNLMRVVQEAADLFQVCLLDSDVAAGGGKLLLVAGAPRSLGDDEERILLVARHIIDSAPPLPVRIGVNRGHVFAGEIGPPYRRTYAVMGDAVNLGARLMTNAPWGGIYATESVLERSQTTFEAAAISPFMAKGKLRPVRAVEVGPMRRPVRAVSTPKRVPLVGRDRELAAIRDALADARAGRGGIVEIVGETGSGKSRLLTEARELADGLGVAHTICENYRRTVPYAVWRDVLRQLLGLHWDDSDDVVDAAIAARIEGRERPLSPWLPLLAIVFDVEVPMTREVKELAPQYRVAKLHEVVLEFLEPSLGVPMLIQIEHAHFMDEASAALLQAIASRLESSAWVVTVTRRDVADGFVGATGRSTQVILGPLSAEAMTELAESTPEASVVPPHLLGMAVERAGGSPEFLLDLLATVGRGSGALPDSMDAAAAARIDELDPGDRILVRRASVLGLCFHRRLLRHVLDSGDSEPVEPTWSRLSGVFADDGDGYVRFKRPALCEVAYEGLPFRLRRQLHSAVGRALEPDLGRDADADPAVLSLHFSLAGDHGQAWKYALVGAKRATARFAHADAAELYHRAIEAGRQDGVAAAELASWWESMAEALQLSGQLTAASEAVSAARRLVGGNTVAQARLFLQHTTVARRAGRLAAAVRWGSRGLRALEGLRSVEARTLRVRLLAALSYVRQRQARLSEAERLCRTAIAEAEAVGEVRALAYASYILDLVLVEAGREDEAMYSGSALDIYERLGDLEQQGNVLNNLAMFAYFRGQWDEALELFERAVDCAERAGNAADVAATKSNIGEILSDRGQYDEAARHLRRAEQLASATGERTSAANALTLLGRLAVRAGRYGEGLTSLSLAADELRRLGEHGYEEFAQCLLAEAEAFGGDARRALREADRLFRSADRSLPLLHRVRGVALLRLGDRAGGLRAVEAAAAMAGEREARYDLACALDLLERLGRPDPRRARERDQILKELQIVQLPQPPSVAARQSQAMRPIAG